MMGLLCLRTLAKAFIGSFILKQYCGFYATFICKADKYMAVACCSGYFTYFK